MIKAEKGTVDMEGTFVELTSDFGMIASAMHDHCVEMFGKKDGADFFNMTVKTALKYFKDFDRKDGAEID